MTARVEIGERGIARAGLTIGFLLAGLLAMHWPMLSSGFARVQFDEGDTRINLYALEHGYRWISGQRHHERLWSPPVYYPLEWTAPCTETLVGVGPAFWVWRAMGAAPDTAYQLWLLSVSALNFLLALTWLRRGRRLPLLASLVGSWLIAFAASRAAQLNHPQLLAACYPLLALLLIDLLPRSRRKSLLLLALGGTIVGQLYAGTYVFLFAGLLGLAGLSILALDPVGRSRLREVLGGQKAALALVLVLAAAAALPWLHASWRASALKGYPSPWEVGQMIPRLASWLSPNPDNVVYGGLATSRPFAGLPMAHEHHLFLGLVTTVVGVGGLLLTRSQMSSRALGGAAAALILLTTALPTPESGTAAWITDAAIPVGLASLTWIGCTWDRRGGASRVAAVCLAAWLLNFGLTGGLSLWTSFCDLAPPLRAIRAVSRVGMLLAIPLPLHGGAGHPHPVLRQAGPSRPDRPHRGRGPTGCGRFLLLTPRTGARPVARSTGRDVRSPPTPHAHDQRQPERRSLGVGAPGDPGPAVR